MASYGSPILGKWTVFPSKLFFQDYFSVTFPQTILIKQPFTFSYSFSSKELNFFPQNLFLRSFYFPLERVSSGSLTPQIALLCTSDDNPCKDWIKLYQINFINRSGSQILMMKSRFADLWLEINDSKILGSIKIPTFKIPTIIIPKSRDYDKGLWNSRNYDQRNY